MKKICISAFIAVGLFLMACPSEDESASKSTPESTSESTSSSTSESTPESASESFFDTRTEGLFDATFTAQTVYFESMDELASIDEGKQIYKFKKTSAKANELKTGSILLLHGSALRKVTKVSEDGNEIVAETSDATLNELIKDGTLEWETHVGFNSSQTASKSANLAATKPLVRIQIADKTYQPTSQTNKEVKFESEIGGYAYQMLIKPEGDSAYVKLEVTKKMAAGGTGKFTAEGRISGLSSSNRIEFGNSKLKSFSNKNKNLKGELTLSLTALGPLNDNVSLELPVVLMEIPQMVGPIPVFLRLKLIVSIATQLPVVGAANKSIHFTYDAETGFKYNGTDVEPDASGGGFSAEEKSGDGVSGPSMTLIQYGIGFPRFEVGIFKNVVVPWIQTAFVIGGEYTPGINLCRQMFAEYSGSYGYEFGFFGLKSKASKNLWKEKKFLQKIGKCPDR